MYQPRKRCFTPTDHLRWITALLGVVVSLLLADVAWADTFEQGSLPPCSQEDEYEIHSSPFYDQDQTLFLRHYVWSVGSGLWRSTDGGRSWQVLLDLFNISGLTIGPVYPVPLIPDPNFQLYLPMSFGVPLGASETMLWYSNDGGATWAARNPCTANCGYFLYPTNLQDVMFGTEFYDPWGHFSSGIWRTNDGARSDWTKVWDGTEAMGLAVSPSYAQDHTVFAGLRVRSPELGSAVIVSTDGGESWEGRGGDDLCSNDAAAVQLSSTFVQDHTVFVHQANSLFKSQDAGNTWQVVFPLDRPHCQPGVIAPEVKDFQLSPNYGQDQTLYMVTQDENGLYLLVSADGGVTWTLQLQLGYYFSLLMVLPRASGATSVLDRLSQHDINEARETRIDLDASPSSPHLLGQDQEWTTFLPWVDWTAAQQTARHFTLFIRTVGASRSYYRSDDGGVTWACMQLPAPPLSQRVPFVQGVK